MTDTTQAAAPTAIVEKRRQQALLDHRMKPAEFSRTEYCVSVDMGVSLEDAMQPDYWAHVAARLRPDDKLCLYSEDRSFYAELLVLATGRADARVALVHAVDLTHAAKAAGSDPNNEYTVQWGSPAVKYRILRLSDKEVIRDSFMSKEAAWTWLNAEYLPNFKRAA